MVSRGYITNGITHTFELEVLMEKANTVHPANGLEKLTKHAVQEGLCCMAVVVTLVQKLKQFML